jgi:hypothetical protein
MIRYLIFLFIKWFEKLEIKFIGKRQIVPKYYMGGVFGDYVLFASLFIGALHEEGII